MRYQYSQPARFARAAVLIPVKILRLLLPAIIPLALSPRAGAGTITVTSLSTILTEMAQNIGGSHVIVVPLVKSGMDPHEYEPQPDDLEKPATRS